MRQTAYQAQRILAGQKLFFSTCPKEATQKVNGGQTPCARACFEDIHAQQACILFILIEALKLAYAAEAAWQKDEQQSLPASVATANLDSYFLPPSTYAGEARLTSKGCSTPQAAELDLLHGLSNRDGEGPIEISLELLSSPTSTSASTPMGNKVSPSRAALSRQF